MTKEERTNIIRAIIRTLDSVTVTGSQNMGHILGCINALNEILEAEDKDG